MLKVRDIADAMTETATEVGTKSGPARWEQVEPLYEVPYGVHTKTQGPLEHGKWKIPSAPQRLGKKHTVAIHDQPYHIFAPHGIPIQTSDLRAQSIGSIIS
jgi:hypothetical protein